jgi:hypothetical protein
MADDKIREGDPEKRKKKAAAKPPADDEEEERPRKKKRPADDEDEDAPRPKKRKRADDEASDLGSSPLSAILPVGGSIFALASLWLSVLSLLAGFACMVLFGKSVYSAILPSVWPIAILCGVVSFFTHKNKASYGSITGNMRAILGILIGLAAMVLHAFLIYWYLADPVWLR